MVRGLPGLRSVAAQAPYPIQVTSRLRDWGLGAFFLDAAFCDTDQPPALWHVRASLSGCLIDKTAPPPRLSEVGTQSNLGLGSPTPLLWLGVVMDERAYLLPEGSRRRRWSWWQYLLLPLAIPVFIVRLFFKLDIAKHRGVTRHLIASSQFFIFYMIACAIFAGVSWIFPFSYAGNPDNLTATDFQALFPDGCDNHQARACQDYGYLDKVQFTGRTMFIVGWIVGYPFRFLSWATGLDFIADGYFWASAIGAHEMVTTGHLGIAYLKGMAVVYWLVVLIPLWIVWSIVNLAIVVAGRIL